MSENTNANSVNLNEKFLEFLKETPEMLAHFVNIINEFYKIQGKVPGVVKQESGPKEWKVDETHELTTVGISHDDLDAMYKGYAEAVVKEKAIAFVKGFIAGVLMVV